MGIMGHNEKNNIHIIRIPEGKEREKETEIIFKAIMTANFLNLRREIDIQIHEAQSNQNRLSWCSSI